MLPKNFDELIRLVFMLLVLCRQKLPGRQMALAVMVALGIHDFKSIGGRSGRSAAMINLKAKGVVELKDAHPEIGRAIADEVDKQIALLNFEANGLELKGPTLERPPEFDWHDLPQMQQEWLHAALLEAAVLQCAHRFDRAEKEIRHLLRGVRVVDLGVRTIGFARLLKRATSVSGDATYDRLERWLIGVFDPNNTSYPRVKDPRVVLAEWLANSFVASSLPRRNSGPKAMIFQNKASKNPGSPAGQVLDAQAAIEHPLPLPLQIEASTGDSTTELKVPRGSTVVDDTGPAKPQASTTADSSNPNALKSTSVDGDVQFPIAP